MKELDENILIRFLQGQCSDREIDEVREWAGASAENARRLFDMEQLYGRVYGDAMPEREIEKALNSVHDKMERRDVRVAKMPRLLRYAAAILVIALTGACVWLLSGGKGIFDRTEYYYVKATNEHPRLVSLADGTRVWINVGSSLRYPDAFDGRIREVELQGEGYFEVAKDSAKPFIVQGEKVSVKVLGTMFNFKNDSERQLAEVSLIEGSVEVSDKKTSNHVLLVPGQRAKVDYNTGQVSVDNANTRLDVVWHNRLIPFENAGIRQIAKTLEQLYGVSIVVDASLDNGRTYSGQIRQKESIDTVLRLLKNTLPISYVRKDNTIYLHPQK